MPTSMAGSESTAVLSLHTITLMYSHAHKELISFVALSQLIVTVVVNYSQPSCLQSFLMATRPKVFVSGTIDVEIVISISRLRCLI